MSNLSKYTCYSGGAIGSDYAWGKIVSKLNGTVCHFYWIQKTPYGNVEISQNDYDEGYDKVMFANKTLKRRPENYMNLLCRNWAQVKYSDAIFAIGKFNDDKKQVDGGTGWAVQMAIDSGKPVYVFDINTNLWHRYNNCLKQFSTVGETPLLSNNFAGIGTRNITKNGVKAIYEICKNTIKWNLKTEKTNTSQRTI